MSIVTRSRRIFSVVQKSNKNARVYSSVSANSPSEPIISSSILGSQPTSSTPPPPPPEGAKMGSVGGKPWSFLRYTSIAALTGGAAAAGYVTYGMCFPSAHLNLYVATYFLQSQNLKVLVACVTIFLIILSLPMERESTRI